jgi:hypothetical protein
MLAVPDDCSFTGAVALAVPSWWPALSAGSGAEAATEWWRQYWFQRQAATQRSTGQQRTANVSA